MVLQNKSSITYTKIDVSNGLNAGFVIGMI
jgi:hypothetical protein